MRKVNTASPRGSRVTAFVRNTVGVAALLLCATTGAQALTVQFSQSLTEAWDLNDINVTTDSVPGVRHTLPLFDPTLGTLLSARIDFSYDIASFVFHEGALPPGIDTFDDDPFTPGIQTHVGFSIAYTPQFSYLGNTVAGTPTEALAICIADSTGSCTAFGEQDDIFSGSIDVALGDLAALTGNGTFSPELGYSNISSLVYAQNLKPLFARDFDLLPEGTFLGYDEFLLGAGVPFLLAVYGGLDIGTATVTYEYTATTVSAPAAGILFLIGAAGIAATRRKRP